MFSSPVAAPAVSDSQPICHVHPFHSQAHPPRSAAIVLTCLLFSGSNAPGSPPSGEPHDGRLDFYRHGEPFETSNSRAISNIEIAKKFATSLVIAPRGIGNDQFAFCRCAASSGTSNSLAFIHVKIAQTFALSTRATCPVTAHERPPISPAATEIAYASMR